MVSAITGSSVRHGRNAHYRVLRLRLKDRGSPHSPERALEIARRIQHHQVSLQQRPWAAGITTLSSEQQELFAAVGLPAPTANVL